MGLGLFSNGFWFLRHGTTDANLAGILMGQRDDLLNEQGRVQARQAAEAFANVGIGAIVSSPLQRCRETAQIVATAIQVPLRFEAGLMERHWGVWQGKPVADKPADHPEGGETYAEFVARVATTLEGIGEPGPVLLVSHGGVFRALADRLNIEGDFKRVPHAAPIHFIPHPTWRLTTAGMPSNSGDEQ